ncbi:MAG: serine/threonine-protein kinase HipA [Planctomycetota bacterium]|jgi:serine/threonine-protein kinase HipA
MNGQLAIEVWADWSVGRDAELMGQLFATPSRGKEIFSFEYDEKWLKGESRTQLDPALGMYAGVQYPSAQQINFGLFLDSSPDRFGRVLMRRREALVARQEEREERRLVESDYLLGVHDEHRMGALRYRTDGAFLDDNDELASPPWTSLRELEQACLQLERDDAESMPNYEHWLRLLIAPGGSLGGARPKASVLDEQGALWIAKFPRTRDDIDIGAWEYVVHELALRAGVDVPEAQAQRFGSNHQTFLTRRFDRRSQGERIHFASALTLLNRTDGDDAEDGASYLELAVFLKRAGSHAKSDLEQLWRRIAFSICVSNTDDHLRNHGFLLGREGWRLSPAYDLNPEPESEGLKLNISESDNAQDLSLLMDVAPQFHLTNQRAEQVLAEVLAPVRGWREIAREQQLTASSQNRMSRAFRVAMK